MKKGYIILFVVILLLVLGIFFNNNSSEDKSIKKETIKNKTNKEKFSYVTKDHDNINELLKETIVEEVKVIDVCENIKTGFIEEDGNTYYYENNKKVTGQKEIEGDTYYFDDNGIMQKDIEIEKAYYGPDGKMVLGEYNQHYYTKIGPIKDDFVNDKYYDLNGEYVEGIKKEKGDIYYNDYKGVIKLNNIRYYFDFKTGKLVKKNIKSVIDISTWQEEIDFDSVFNSGLIDAIIVRIGFGSISGEDCTLDNRFERNISEIKRLGIPYGIYFYGYAQNEEAASVEANFVDNIVKTYELDPVFPIFYDAEISNLNGVNYTKAMYKKVINRFISDLKEKGYNNVGVYGNIKMLSTGTLSFLDNEIPKWVAQYNTTCEYDKEYVGWQYTSTGKIPGINTYVDFNIFY
ncbi:MAG: hypothetical protein IKF36_02250 [Bacilli bacterium]|nr:hypothetical protein [Bacilli bacterium]